MTIFETIKDFRTFRKHPNVAGKRIGLVPTMGALHEGHLKLIEKSLEICEVTIVTIFVNPTQFNNQDDLKAYPRTFTQDKRLLEKYPIDGIFHPAEDEIYTEDSSVTFDLGEISARLEGEHRPGHFNGVALIVSKLFNIVQPDVAFFGEKDLQQLQIIRKLTHDLCFPIEIRGVATVRSGDGLALSSRNTRLSASGLELAAQINKGLEKGARLLEKRESRPVVLRSVEGHFASFPGLKVEYCELVDPTTMTPIVNYFEKEDVALVVAAYVEGVRLIDNIYLRLKRQV